MYRYVNLSTLNCILSGAAALALFSSGAAAESFSAEGVLVCRSYVQDTPREEAR